MNTSHYKEILNKEKAELEEKLGLLGRKNPYMKGDWEAAEPEDGEEVEEGELADKMTEFNDNTEIVEQLETRLRNVVNAISKIENGTYGICETCGEKIEEDRLEANPAATTCKAHMG